MLNSQAGITHDTAHSEGIHRIVTRDCNDADPIRHNNVSTLTKDAEARFLESSNSIEMVDAGYLGHG